MEIHTKILLLNTLAVRQYIVLNLYALLSIK